MKRIFDFEEMMASLEMAEELDLPYKLLKIREPHFNEATDQTTLVTVWLFKFL